MGHQKTDTGHRTVITGRQTIEIGEVRCSVVLEDGFFQKEFDSILSSYKHMGFCTERKPEIKIIVRGQPIPLPSLLTKKMFYYSMDYDSVTATLFFDMERFEGHIGIAINRDEMFTPVRIWELVETFICNAYLFYFLFNELGTFIHSSSIADDTGGYIFAGHSGAGKSTIARLSSPRTILSDDLVLLRKGKNGKRQVFGTPFVGDSPSINRGVDCKAIYFLEKDDSCEIVPVTRMDSVVRLMKEGVIGGFIWHDAIQNIYPYSRYLFLLIDLFDGIPCFKLRFKKDNSFCEVINGKRG